LRYKETVPGFLGAFVIHAGLGLVSLPMIERFAPFAPEVGFALFLRSKSEDHRNSAPRAIDQWLPFGWCHSWASLVDLAELLFQFGDQRIYALSGLVVRSRQLRHLAILHDLHFEFHALVL
jgi:hypothetical protein